MTVVSGTDHYRELALQSLARAMVEQRPAATTRRQGRPPTRMVGFTALRLEGYWA